MSKNNTALYYSHFLPFPFYPIYLPEISTHPLICLSRKKRSYISILHHSTVSPRLFIEALNEQQHSVTHTNCQVEVCMCVCLHVCARECKYVQMYLCMVNLCGCTVDLDRDQLHRIMHQREKEKLFPPYGPTFYPVPPTYNNELTLLIIGQ